MRLPLRFSILTISLYSVLTASVPAFNGNASLYSRWGEGEQLGVRYHYLENYLGVSTDLGKWHMQAELAYNHPPEYGYQLTGLRQGLISYRNKDFLLEAGTLTQVFGSGMSLNLFEELEIDFNNLPVGMKLDFQQTPIARWTFLAGRKAPFRFYSPSSNSRQPDGEADYWLGGAQVIFSNAAGNRNVSPYLIVSRLESPIQRFIIDASTLDIVLDTLSQRVLAQTAGLSVAMYYNTWDLMVEAARTEKVFDEPLLSQRIYITNLVQGITTETALSRTSGYGIFGRANVYFDAMAVLLEYKHYQMGVESPGEKRNPFQLATKPLPFQAGPTGLRQHDMSLLANITHPVDYGDEIGFNVELQSPVGYNWILRGQASILSAGHATSQLSSLDQPSPGRILPAFNKKFAPFQEYLVEWDFAGLRLDYRGALAVTSSTLSGQTNETSQYFTIIPAYMSYRLNETWVVAGVSEFQTATVTSFDQNDSSLGGFGFDAAHGILSVDWRAKISVAAVWDYTNDPTQVDEEGNPIQNWLSGEVSVRPSERVQFRASYGSEKGGVRCTGGVCRVINPFKGARVTLEVRL